MAKKKKRCGANDALISPDLNSASTARIESIPPINSRSPVPGINIEPSTSSLIICRNKYAENSRIVQSISLILVPPGTGATSRPFMVHGSNCPRRCWRLLLIATTPPQVRAQLTQQSSLILSKSDVLLKTQLIFQYEQLMALHYPPSTIHRMEATGSSAGGGQPLWDLVLGGTGMRS